MCVVGFQDHREVALIYPSAPPVDARLGSGEPGVAKDDLVSAQVGEEEPHSGVGRASPNPQVCVELEVSGAIRCSINVEDRSRRKECFDG